MVTFRDKGKFTTKDDGLIKINRSGMTVVICNDAHITVNGKVSDLI